MVKKIDKFSCGFVSILILFLSVNYAFSNSSQRSMITSIIISGNENTKDEVIKRELLFNVGDTPSDSLLEFSKNRLLALGLFSRVEFYYLPANGGVDILVLVNEQLQFFPYPIFNITDRDWNKITIGGGITHVNLFGMNHKINAALAFGYNAGYSFNYKVPWLGLKQHYYLNVVAKKYRARNRAQNFEEKHLKFSTSIGKYWTRYFYTIVVPYFDRIMAAENYAPLMSSGTVVDNLAGISVASGYDTRDLTYYPSRGVLLSAVAVKSGLFVDYLNYWKYQIDLRKFYTIKGITLAGRLSTTQSIGELPIYDRVYLGFGERIRGHFYDIYEGRHIVIGQLECRFTLMKIRYYAIPAPAFISSSLLKNLKFGLNGAFFIDSGEVWSKPEELKFNRLISGFGASLIARVPYSEILRLDMAFDKNFNMQWIFEIGMAF
jgi:outer membrane protein assembly factor BamA